MVPELIVAEITCLSDDFCKEFAKGFSNNFVVILTVFYPHYNLLLF